MKKFFTLFALAAMVILTACGGGKNTINKDSLQGRYEIDFTSFVKEVLTDASADELPADFAASFISKMEITAQFESETVVVDASRIAAQYILNDLRAGFTFPMSLKYKIENDSVLYVKGKEDQEFEKFGVLSKVGDGYDYLKLAVVFSGKNVEFGLKKVK